MSHLDPDILPLVALGEQELTDDDRAHLAECAACASEVAELRHTAAVGRSSIVIDTLESPPDRVWNAIADELGVDPATLPAAASVSAPSPSPADPAVPTDAAQPAPPAVPQTRREAAQRASSSGAARRRPGGWTRALFALAATVALVVVVGGVWTITSLPTTVPIASAELLAFPAHPGAHGEAVVEERGDERVVVVSLDADPIPGTFREVWLISADATQIVSLGTLDSASGTFSIPADIDLAEFVLVDISAEPEDGAPEHSGDSIVRGELQSA